MNLGVLGIKLSAKILDCNSENANKKLTDPTLD